MWGVSWANVEMMLADAQRTDYDSKSENRNNEKDADVLDLSKPTDVEKLKRLAR